VDHEEIACRWARFGLCGRILKDGLFRRTGEFQRRADAVPLSGSKGSTMSLRHGAWLLPLVVFALTGCEYVPAFPWSYSFTGSWAESGWSLLGILGSCLVWLLLLIGALAILGGLKDRDRSPIFAGLLVLAVCFGIIQVVPRPTVVPVVELTALAKLKQTVADWATKRDETEKFEVDLRVKKAEVLAKLREEGVSNANDLAKSEKAQVYARELRDIVARIDQAQKKYREYDLAVTQVESAVRRLEIEEQAQRLEISDSELVELTATVARLDSELRNPNVSQITRAMEVDDVLNRELGNGSLNIPLESTPPAKSGT